MSELDIFVRRIEERVVEGKRLGRHVRHDVRSLQYLIAEAAPATVRWSRMIAILDQGQVGSCTGNAMVGAIGTEPDYDDVIAALPTLSLDESLALAIYSDAENIDGDGPYPPNDNGSSGRSVAQAAKARGLISGYLHATTVGAVHAALQAGPVIIGSDWYDSFDNPDASGLVAIAAGATVRGGHEYECVGYDTATDLFELVNSWGASWGVSGHFFYSSATLATLLTTDGDATSFVPITKPAPTPSPTPQPVPTPTPPVPPTPPAPPIPTPTPTPTPPTPPAPPQGFWGGLLALLEDLEHALGAVTAHVRVAASTIDNEGDSL